MSNPNQQPDAPEQKTEETPGSAAAAAPAPEPVLSEADEEIIRKRLQDLGYIE